MSKKTEPVRPVRSTYSGWRGDVLAGAVIVVLVIVVMKGCNAFFPGDFVEPPPSVESEQ